MARNYYSKPRKKSGKYAYFSNQFTKRNGECVTVKPPDRKMPCIIYPRTLNNKQYGEPYPLLFFKIRTLARYVVLLHGNHINYKYTILTMIFTTQGSTI